MGEPVKNIVRKKVRYTCEFEATIEFDSETEDEQDAVSDINIPEGGKNDSRYVENTFCILDEETLDSTP